ncbi:MAG: 50S ribosomal protein L6 [Paludibacteraceae bacterium]|nr:50S ribosomal protein L6 [Candidatus Colicola caccequi]MCQ2328028.1 50S ribosomal protein L6 [Paludibacteraceae bacterium]MCQ2339497.1 50S ribosomal protein L6 [Paludibacteraceae bacterium]
MSRIGKLPIAIPAGVTVAVSSDNVVTVKGPKGELSQKVDPSITVTVEGNVCTVTRPNDEKQTRANHGLYRALINNMVYGVSEGYKATLQLHGVGYRVEMAQTPNTLNFTLGYTHPIYMQLPKEVKVETKTERNQDPLIMLECADKQLIGQICAKIRTFRKPEPYKGKGILFLGEVVRRKAGKSAAK